MPLHHTAPQYNDKRIYTYVKNHTLISTYMYLHMNMYVGTTFIHTSEESM